MKNIYADTNITGRYQLIISTNTNIGRTLMYIASVLVGNALFGE